MQCPKCNKVTGVLLINTTTTYTCSECSYAWEKVDPVDGGCWFCKSRDVGRKESILFSFEFDCYVHEHCLRRAAKPWDDGSIDPEAAIMFREIFPGEKA